MPVVTDYTALLNPGATWAGSGAPHTPVFLTFSFDLTAPDYYLDGRYGFSWSEAAAHSFTPFTEQEKTIARQALAAWSAVSGVIFLEAGPGEGTLRFGNVDVGLLGGREAAFAQLPSIVLYRPGGDVFVSTDVTPTLHLLEHEIGHALGFKHPSDGSVTLDPAIDLNTNTIMSVTGGNGGADQGLGFLDVAAIQYLYGPNSSQALGLRSWSWDAHTSTLTRVAGDAGLWIEAVDFNNVVQGGAGADTMGGGFGDNTLAGGAGADNLDGGAGRSLLDGGDGNDLLSALNSAAHNTLLGGAGDDLLVGGSGAGFLDGGSGNDFLTGNAGNDTLIGGAGADNLTGGDGDDVLIPGPGQDTVDGGLGYDTVILAGKSTDFSFALFSVGDTRITLTDQRPGSPEGVDTLRLVEALQFDDRTIQVHNGVPMAQVDVGSGAGASYLLDPANSTLLSSIGHGAVSVGATATSFQLDDTNGSGLVWTFTGRLFNFGAGRPLSGLVTAFSATAAHGPALSVSWLNAVDLTFFLASPSPGAMQSLLSQLIDASVAIHGNDSGLLLTAHGGDDYLQGGASSDTLSGGAGADTLVGGGGDDSLSGGAGIDEAHFGGNRSDYQVQETSDGFTIRDLRPGSPDGADFLVGVERAIFADSTLVLGTAPTLHGPQLTNSARPTLTGTAKAGSTVQILDGALVVGELLAGGDGAFTYTPATPLGDGIHLVLAQTVGSGGAILQSAALSLTVDTVSPPPPEVHGPTLTNNGKPQLGGAAEPGSTVTVFDNGVAIGAALVTPLGFYSFVPGSRLPDGTHTLTATATDAAGNVSSASQALSLTIDTTPPPAPIYTRFDVSGASVIITGHTEPMAEVIALFTKVVGSQLVFLDQANASAFADAQGVFTITAVAPFADGQYEFSLYSLDSANNASSQVFSKIFAVDDLAQTSARAVLRVDLNQLPGASQIIADHTKLGAAGVVSDVIKMAAATSSVATLAYEFFTGSVPSASGMDFLVAPSGPNPNNLNSAYYQSFNLENRYINFAVNLGKNGAGAANFTADYGALSLFEATRLAYARLFGDAPSDAKLHALLDPTSVLNGQAISRAEYFALYGGDGANGIGTKAAMVGWLLAEAVKADLGTYALSNDAFLTDVALHGASFGVDIIGHYAQPGFVFHPG